MVNALFAVLSTSLVVLIVASDVRRRRGETSTSRRRQLTLVQIGGGAAFLALSGFEQAFGLIADPGLPEPVGTVLHPGLLVLSVVGFGGAWYFHRQNDRNSRNTAS